MKIRSIDVETTTHSHGNPFDERNSLVCWSFAESNSSGAYKWNEGDVQGFINEADLLVGFNIKFDLQWLTKAEIKYNPKRVWDVQLAEFILSHQTNRFPSLNDTCIKYGLPTKHDKVAEYWKQGVQTNDIPWPILEEYAAYDAWLTLQCYYKQKALMSPAQIKLCFLQCQDLSILREMEYNGLPFNEELCHLRAKELDEKITELNKILKSIYPDVPINFGSNDHMSAFLYGGTVKEDGKEFVGYFKGGQKAGQPKYKNVVIEHKLPRLYTPLKGSEMQKEGNFATDEGTLRKLKGNKKIISMVLELAKLEKLNGTYYRGLTKLREEMHWEPGVLHGNFNQTQAVTGRLSSSKPNLQNMASDIQDIFVSRYTT